MSGPPIDSPTKIRASRACRSGAGMVGDDSNTSVFQEMRVNISGRSPKASGSFVTETFLPTPDHRFGLSGGLHDLRRAVTSGRQKDDICPPNVLLRTVAIGNHGLKLVTVGAVQLDVRSLVHPLDSHTRAPRGIPKRIELLDLVH